MIITDREVYRAGHDEAKKWARFFDNHDISDDELRIAVLDMMGNPEKMDEHYTDGIIDGLEGYIKTRVSEESASA